MPVLVMADNEDQLIPVSNAHFLASAIPGSTLVLFDGGGHLFMLSHPQAFARALVAFLDDTPGERSMAHYDLILRGGTIVDGTGAPRHTGDVAIRDGLIAAVGTVTGTALREIDATGLVVARGWVDMHTHYGGQ
eukprot:gene25944-33378_t